MVSLHILSWFVSDDFSLKIKIFFSPKVITNCLAAGISAKLSVHSKELCNYLHPVLGHEVFLRSFRFLIWILSGMTCRVLIVIMIDLISIRQFAAMQVTTP